jgi:chromosomal replication initiation ATPase DnaA
MKTEKYQINVYAYPGIVYSKETIEGILQAICMYFDVSVEQIRSKDRHRPIPTIPRQLAMYFAAKYIYPKLSYEKIAEQVAHKDRSTIYNSIDVIEQLRKTDVDVKQWYDDLEKMLNK